MAVTDYLKDLVAINTIADNNNDKIMDYLQKKTGELGFTAKRLKSDETGKEIMICEYGDEQALAFLGHTDTVDITDGWVTDPHVLTDKGDGMLYGLGACDMKGGLACALQAVSEIDRSKLKKGIKFYFTYDEEILFKGIADLVASGEKTPEHIVVCEPTCLGPGTFSKGLLELKITMKGITTHSSQPIPGKSSNKNAVKFLSKMMDFEESLKSETNSVYDIPHVTMNIGIVNGGTSINKVPAETVIYLDFRIVDSEKQYRRIRDAVDNNLKEACGGDESMYSYEIINDIASFFNDGSELASLARDMVGVEHSALNGITEASFLTGDRIIFGPGPMTAHEKNEHVSVEDLNMTVNVYKKIIERCCM